MEAVNMICGNAGDAASPGISTHLEISELKLPTLEENNVDHTAGGAMLQIEIPMYVNKLEATFNLAGWNPDVMAYFGQQAANMQQFTAYGLVRNRHTSEALRAIAIFYGRLGRVNPTNFRKGDLMHHEYSLKSIIHYELYLQEVVGAEPEEIYYVDFFTSEFRSGGVPLTAEMNTILAIPGTAL